MQPGRGKAKAQVLRASRCTVVDAVGCPGRGTPLQPGLPTMMVQALTNPISFLSVTRSEEPGPGPGPGEGEGAGPRFPRPLGCCVWPVMSLSRRVPAPSAAPSVRSPCSRSFGRSVRPSVGRSVRASLTAGQRPPAGACAGKRPGPGPVRGRRGPRSGGRRTGSRALPSARGSPPPSGPERREDSGRCREHFSALGCWVQLQAHLPPREGTLLASSHLPQSLARLEQLFGACVYVFVRRS